MDVAKAVGKGEEAEEVEAEGGTLPVEGIAVEGKEPQWLCCSVFDGNLHGLSQWG